MYLDSSSSSPLPQIIIPSPMYVVLESILHIPIRKGHASRRKNKGRISRWSVSMVHVRSTVRRSTNLPAAAYGWTGGLV
ncbi:hypothetical protein EJ05DRAFT_479930, partial [Pseudovirgaria hyperparasitica]